MTKLREQAAMAQKASFILAVLSTEEKNRALYAIAKELRANIGAILAANGIDLENGKKAGISPALMDRLALDEKRIEDMALGVEQVAKLPDPVGVISQSWQRPNGLIIERVQVPLGVIGVIYEARPNVTVDCCALALKTGNALVLRGSSSALNSNTLLVKTIHEALKDTAIPPAAVQIIDRPGEEAAREMMSLNEYIDVLIPRGGAGLIRAVLENSTIPVLETGTGNCHIYADASAKPQMAKEIIINGKTHRPAVCNATETILLHKDWAREHLPSLAAALEELNVELRGCPKARAIYPMAEAAEKDWGTEYLALILAVKVVENIEEAIEHITKYGTKHTEAIITENPENAGLFLKRVDAAAVNHNASTRFTDGFEYGFGAEIGISTQKLHARGPLGPKELTTFKYLVHGSGQIR